MQANFNSVNNILSSPFMNMDMDIDKPIVHSNSKKRKRENETEVKLSNKKLETDSLSITSLPPEILHYIFKFLPSSKLNNVNLVNRQWNEITKISFDERFAKHSNLLQTIELLKEFISSNHLKDPIEGWNLIVEDQKLITKEIRDSVENTSPDEAKAIKKISIKIKKLQKKIHETFKKDPTNKHNMWLYKILETYPELKKDLSFMTSAVKLNTKLAHRASPEIQRNHSYLLTLIKKKGFLINSMAQFIKNDRIFILKAMKVSPNTRAFAACNISDELKKDKNFMKIIELMKQISKSNNIDGTEALDLVQAADALSLQGRENEATELYKVFLGV